MSDYDNSKMAGERGDGYKTGMDHAAWSAGVNQRNEDFAKTHGPQTGQDRGTWPTPHPSVPSPPPELWSTTKKGAMGGLIVGLLLCWFGASQPLSGQVLIAWGIGGAFAGISLGLAWWLLYQVFKVLAILLPWVVGLAVLAFFVPEVRGVLVRFFQLLGL